MVYKKPTELIQKTTECAKNTINERRHVYIEGEYRNRESVLIVGCPTHEEVHQTTFYNYLRARTGLKCCGREQVSQKLTNRKFSDETIEKMSTAALLRAKRGGKPRDWRETTTYWRWREQVMTNYKNVCAITGISKEGSLEVHHLYSVSGYPHLTYIAENGIVLCNSLHVRFHKMYKYGLNTIEQFQTFLLFLLEEQEQKNKSMLISSQANSEGLEGSETRAYDPERVMELHERLEGLKTFLYSVTDEG